MGRYYSEQVLTMWVLVLIGSLVSLNEAEKCKFKAIFNFGDSNSDTGGFYAAFPSQSPPFGMTFFNNTPSGRASDGRLLIDFFEHLPPPDMFEKSIYTLDIGQNDFTSNLADIGIEGVRQYLPEVAFQIVETIKVLYAEGGRTFLVSNLAPIGCFPAFLVQLPHNESDLDMYGCMVSYNNAVSDYNTMLKEKLQQARALLLNASIVYVDTHSVKLELFRHPTHHELLYGTKACCGFGGGTYNFNPQLYCGNSKVINGTKLTATACPDPQNYVSWDGIHATEAANKLITWAILNGSYFDPPFQLSKLCNLQPIG